MNIPYVMKRCTKCGRWLVASTVNFHRMKVGKYGLQSKCKECACKYSKQYCENNKERIAERRKQYYEANREKELEKAKQYYEDNREKALERHKQWCKANPEYHKQWYQNNKERILEQQKQYRQNNKEKVLEQRKQYYQANREKVLEQRKQYYQTNREKVLEQKKQWNRNNKEKLAEYHKQWYQDNREKDLERQKQWQQTPQGQASIFNTINKRRLREQQQGDGITKDQWLEMMQYFEWKCAYSGETLTDKTRSVDHIVPLNSGGDNMIWNCVPMLRNLNSSKHANNMEEWYKEQDCYDPKRLQKIYEWQEYAYNKYGKDSEYFNTNDIQIKLL